MSATGGLLFGAALGTVLATLIAAATSLVPFTIARRLGRAAAPNLVIGRSDHGKTLFDDGDEVVVAAKGSPEAIADFQERRCHNQVSKVNRVCARWLRGCQTSRLKPTTVTAMMPTAAART